MTDAPSTLWCEHALLPEGVVDRVALALTDGRITAIVTDAEPPPGAARRAGLTIPGVANTHSHAFHRALRHHSQTGGGSFWTWRRQMYDVAARLDPDRYRGLARAVFAEMVTAGYTCVGEFHYLHHAADGTPYDDPDAMGAALLAAAGEAGIRITLLDTLYLHGGLDTDGYRPLEGPQRRFGDGSVERWIGRASGRRATPASRPGAAVHSVRAVDPDSIAVAAAWARDADLPLHAHVSEQAAENDACLARLGRTPTGTFESSGALGGSFTAIHATHLDEADVGRLGASGAGVCLCPTTERDLGDGIGPARRLLDAGVGLSIGSDSHAVVDPFEEVRAIELDERLWRQRRGVLTAEELVAALHAGHRALGWADGGSIAIGAPADLVTVRLDSARTAGARPGAVAAALVFAATAADVSHVMIGGMEVVSDGRHRTIDVAGELGRAVTAVLT